MRHRLSVTRSVKVQDGSGNAIGSTSGALNVNVQNAGDIDVGVVSLDQGDPGTLGNAWPVKVTEGTVVLGTSTNPIRVNPTGTTTQPVSASSLPLPSGAATEATLGDVKARLGSSVDANNTVTVALPIYAGVAYSPNVGGAPLPTAADTWAGSWTDITNFAGVTVTPRATALGQGYAEFSNDAGATINHYYTTPFIGGGDFAIPKAASHYRLLFQNRDIASTNTFKVQSIANYDMTQPFLFPVAGTIDATFPAILNKTVITGQNPSGSFVNVGTTTEGDLSTGQRAVISPSATLTGPSAVGTGNSATGTLDPAASFTGAWEVVSDFSEINILASVTQTSATNGAQVQFSDDGVNVRRFVPATIVGTAVGGVGISVSFHPEGKYFRLIYTNGSVATSIAVQTIFKYLSSSQIQLLLAQSLSDVNAATITRSIVSAKNPTGSYVNIGATTQGDLRIGQSAVTSTLNSTTTPLLAATTFTGTFENVNDFASLGIVVNTDSVAASGALTVEWSTDGTNVDLSSMRNVTTGGDFVSFATQAKFARVKFTAGVVDQTYLRLQTRYSYLPFGPTLTPLLDEPNDAFSALSTRAVLSGKNPGGDYVNVGTGPEGSIMTTVGERPSQVLSRTPVHITFENVTGDTTIYTVTVAKTLYITSFSITSINTNTGTNGRMAIRDNGAGGTIKIPLVIAQQAGGASGVGATAATALPEPMSFSSNVFVDIIAGTIFTSGFLIGYEEPN